MATHAVQAMQPGKVIRGHEVEGALALECDVVVVGSGAGGGAAAYELAASGLDVVVLEEGGYRRTQQFEVGRPQMTMALYRDAGSNVIFGTPDILFSEGCTVGGSTVVNAGMSWRTPAKVLKRWVWEQGLPPSRIAPEAMDPIFARVEDIIHVAPQSEESIGEDSRRIKRGCDALGYRAVPAQRSQRDCMGTNNCIYGCPTGAKQSTLVTYLPRAVALGARIYADTRVTRIRVDATGRATGVDAEVRNPYTQQRTPARVRARAVVVAGGATQTPVLLQASKLGNRWVGRNLLVHPNAKAVAVYDEDVFGWKGTIQGYQVHEFVDEGIIMGTTFVPPTLLAATLPQFGREIGEVMQDYNRMVSAGVLIEDSTSGTVRRSFGQAIMRYQLTRADIDKLLRGIALLAEIYFASGARKVYLPVDGLPVITSVDEIRKLFTHPLDPKELEVLTVHAMGTARMSDDAARGATRPDGQLWGHAGLYVADASLFPTPIGVNPQITVMALATHVAWEVAEGLARAG